MHRNQPSFYHFLFRFSFTFVVYHIVLNFLIILVFRANLRCKYHNTLAYNFVFTNLFISCNDVRYIVNFNRAHAQLAASLLKIVKFRNHWVTHITCSYGKPFINGHVVCKGGLYI
ncbi:hypothetical protein Hanom_Chr06g00507421 [Helianthus anomalus]